MLQQPELELHNLVADSKRLKCILHPLALDRFDCCSQFALVIVVVVAVECFGIVDVRFRLVCVVIPKRP